MSTRSLRKYVGVLEALDLIRETENGYRLALPVQDDDRGDPICPEPVASDATTATELLWDVADVLLDDPMRLADLDDPVGAAFAHPVDFDALRRECPRINPGFASPESSVALPKRRIPWCSSDRYINRCR